MRRASLALATLTSAVLYGQTANETVPPWNADFGQGINFGWYAGWTDDDLARLSTGTRDGTVAGIGVNALRPGLFAHFLEEWGYDIREEAFATYTALGSTENVVIMGFPSPEQRGTEEWCPGRRTETFRGMWAPIWDDNHGTPFNEDNAYAAYVYQAVEVYGPHVRVYEIWNEPDIGDGPNDGWMPRGEEGNWYDNPVDPCDLKIKAPIQAYVRLLRISYEIIKRLDPEAYVAVGGLGYPSYLDNLLRYTDEPTSGAVTADYPLTGGAYFDALSLHVYPHLEDTFREWDNDRRDWDWTRNSDRALDAFRGKMLAFEGVLADYGYDGSRYPEKVVLCTETNLPRAHFDHSGARYASPQMQRNYILKLLARAQQWGVVQVHPYQLADQVPEASAGDEFELMGFYRDIADKPFSATERTSLGVAYATYGELLRGATYDAALTDGLGLPDGATGVGLRLPSGRTAYVLWAETTQDGVEDNVVSYAPAGELALGRHVAAAWDYNVTRAYRSCGDPIESMVGGTSTGEPPAGDAGPCRAISLSGSPIILIDGAELGLASSLVGGDGAAVSLTVSPSLAPVGTPTVAIELASGACDCRMDVYDATGRRVYATPSAPSGARATTSLPVGSLPAGAYRVTATRDDGSVLGAGFVLR